MAPLVDDEGIADALGDLFSSWALLDLIHQQGARAISIVDAAPGAIEEIKGLLGIPRGVTVLHLDLHQRSLPEGEERFH